MLQRCWRRRLLYSIHPRTFFRTASTDTTAHSHISQDISREQYIKQFVDGQRDPNTPLDKAHLDRLTARRVRSIERRRAQAVDNVYTVDRNLSVFRERGKAPPEHLSRRRSLLEQSIDQLDQQISIGNRSRSTLSVNAGILGLNDSESVSNMERKRDRPSQNATSNYAGGRPLNRNDGSKRRKVERKVVPTLTECGNTDVLDIEAKALLAKPREQPIAAIQPETESSDGKRHSRVRHEFELDVEGISSIGEGLIRHPSAEHVYVVPFSLPGDRVKFRGLQPQGGSLWSKADFLEVVTPSKLREGTTPQCQYFGKCGGCQLQMISYEEQLKHKRTVVQGAYRHFSGLKPEQIPTIGETGASPLQYNYRTKLTPHFDGPPKGTRYSASNIPPIGFTLKNYNKVMDIESCPIGTEIVQRGFRLERDSLKSKISEFKRGVTMLLRENTDRSYESISSDPAQTSPGDLVSTSPLPKDALLIPGLSLQPKSPSSPPANTTRITPTIQNTYLYQPPTSPHPTHILHETKRYTTDNAALTTEHIGNYLFKTRAGSFFQNNNSILPSFLSYVRSVILPSPSPTCDSQPIKYLLDAYCGSGLFALTLSPLFTSVLGIELDPWGVSSARTNAQLNNIGNCGFIEADASALFVDVPFPASQTALVIDPPRKGCSVDFLKQLLRYGPARVVYVSCNVGSQARDVGVLVRGACGGDWWKGVDEGTAEGDDNGDVEVGRYRYEIEELRGFDFFPQTGHVEGLCVLKRVDNEGWKGE